MTLSPFPAFDAANDVDRVIAEAFFQDPQPVLKTFLDDLEKRLILAVLDRVGGNQREAARILGVKYTTLNEKVKRFGILFEKRIVAVAPAGESAGMTF